MGNCYNVDKKENDLINDIEHLQKINQNSKHLSENNIVDIKNDIFDIDINNIDTKINVLTTQTNEINTISKTKLKLTIKQSKNLPEGKEYIINSYGLLINNENKTKDGLTIFGDKNVIKYIILYNKYLIQSNARIDFIFPEEESNTKQNHAEIRYDQTLELYQIRSLRGNGCFLKIEQKIVSNI